MGGKWKTALLCLVLGSGVFAGSASAAPRDIHIDCSAALNGDGSASMPFNSISAPFDLRAGDNMSFRRGTRCEGMLQITDSGQGADPKSVGAYGTGPKPKIIGTGQDAVRLTDVSDLTFRDLDISNPGSGGPLGQGTQVRNGVKVIAQVEGVRNLSLTGLDIHDVDGDLTKNPQGSAGIQVSATGPPPARFVNLTISDNRITSVSRSAISITGTNDPNRPSADQPWPLASTGLVVENNRIDLIAGDGIVSRGTDGALIQGNVVSRGNLAGRPLLHPDGPMCNAGIWAFRANNTVIRGNEVFGMEYNGCDGTGFDIDYRQDGTVVEGNFSHDNEGGFILLCTDEATHRADVRFNLSVDDGTMINHGPCGIEDGILGDLSGIRMFNNTVVGETPTVSVQLGISSEMYEPGGFVFVNNLLYAKQPIARIPCGNVCSHNAFFNLPASGTEAVTGDPLLTTDYRLSPGSPLRGAGTPVIGGGETDYFGNPVPDPPAIGFDQTPGGGPGQSPSRACLKARTRRNKARRKVKSLVQNLRRLRRNGATRSRVKSVARRLDRARTNARQQAKTARRTCLKPAT